MPDVKLPYQFTPRHYQVNVARAILSGGQKRAVCVWHRRAGKDKTFLNILVTKAMELMANYAYYFPTATLGRKALWDNIDARSGMRVIDHIPPELLAKKNEQQMKLTLVNGSTIQVLGTDNLDVVGGNYMGVIFSESAQHNPLAWDYIRPILAENGGWAIFNGTPRGKNWFYRLYDAARRNPAWFCELLSVNDTAALTLDDINEERKAGMPEEMIRQEFYCDFTVGLIGAVYARQIEQARVQRRIDFMPADGGQLVHTAWDLGSPMNTVVWYFQIVGRMIRFIQCDVGCNETIIERWARMKNSGMHFGDHFLPHDALQTERSGRTLATAMQEAGMQNLRIVPRCDPNEGVWYGINHAKQLFSSLEFAEEPCRRGLEMLESYHTREEVAGVQSRNEPVHDFASHAADAFRTFAEAHAANMIKFNWADLSGLPDWSPARRRRGQRSYQQVTGG